MPQLLPAPLRSAMHTAAGGLQRPWVRWFNQVFASGVRGELVEITYHDEDLVDQVFFIANRSYYVKTVRAIHSTAGSDSSDVEFQLTKDTSTGAPGSGVDVLAAAVDLKATANTVQAPTLSTTEADRKLSAGDRLAIAFTGTLTAVAGLVVTVTLRAL